ncbi:MAG: hypothetical protein EB060_07925 [Proteobacteria bacterium]|nr:hypothetical protein [Pseudomonadota bacterium]
MIVYKNTDAPSGVESSQPAVSWCAVFAGAVAAAALSIVIAILGSGLGLTVLSPYSHPDTVVSVAVGALVWLIFVQWASSALGGYITGRLRTKWVSVMTEEVFFRDTVHGFLAWSLATLITAGFITSSTLLLANGAMKSPPRDEHHGPHAYYINVLFRSDNVHPIPPDVREDAAMLLARSIADKTAQPDDRDYLVHLVSVQTGLNQDESRRRVEGVIAQVQTTADKSRKAMVALSISTALAMMVGAFIASVSAALGGRQRDQF